MADAKDFKVVSTVDGSYLMYRGQPLVREDNVICYGSMDDEYILQMIIMSTKEEGGQAHMSSCSNFGCMVLFCGLFLFYKFRWK